MSKTTKELADELDAAECLRKRGYQQEPCPSKICQQERHRGYVCPRCNGTGRIWKAPLTR